MGRQECDSLRTTNYPGIQIVHIWINQDPPVYLNFRYQYPPDMNPLMLAAHKNDHELVQLFLSRGYIIARPHSIDCQCDDCQVWMAAAFPDQNFSTIPCADASKNFYPIFLVSRAEV